MQQSSSPLSVNVYRDLSAKRGGSVVRPHHCSLLWSSKSDPHAKRDSGILTLSPCSQLLTVLLLLPQWRFALSPRPGKDGLRALLSPSGRRRVPLNNGKGPYSSWRGVSALSSHVAAAEACWEKNHPVKHGSQPPTDPYIAASINGCPSCGSS